MLRGFTGTLLMTHMHAWGRCHQKERGDLDRKLAGVAGHALDHEKTLSPAAGAAVGAMARATLPPRLWRACACGGWH